MESSTIGSSQIKLIASELRNARETGGLVEPQVVESLTNLEQAYAIQSAQIDLFPEGIVGWKIGPTKQAKLTAYDIDEPLIAPVFASKCYTDGARFPIHMPHRPKLEAEIALRLGADIDAQMAAGGQSAIRDAVEAALPAVEVVSFRYFDPTSTAQKIVADGGANAGVIVGDTALPFSKLPDLSIDIARDGEPVAKGSIGELLWGDILDSVVWLAQHHVLGNRGLRAGDMVFTGACTALVPIEPGQTVSVNFGGLGSLTTPFVDASDPAALTGEA